MRGLWDVPFVSGLGHYNEARHGLIDVARDKPLPHSGYRPTSGHMHTRDDQNRMAETLLHAAQCLHHCLPVTEHQLCSMSI